MPLPFLQLLSDLGRRALAEGVHECLAFLDGSIDLGSVVKVVRQRGVHVSERQIIFAADLVNAHAEPLVPDGDILDGDSMTSNPWLSARNSRRTLNMLIQRLCGHA
jgi:hypothetical protein